MKADIVIRNAKCLTMKDGFVADWIAMKGKNILSLGLSGEEDSLIGSDTLVLDADGNTVLPGFIDSHFHVVQTALNAKCMDLSKVTGFADIGMHIKETMEKNNKKFLSIVIPAHNENRNVFKVYLELKKVLKKIPDYVLKIVFIIFMLYYSIRLLVF